MDPDLREELMDEVDEVWAESLRHLPMKSGVPDPERAPSVFTAVLRTGDRAVERVGAGRGNAMRPAMTSDGGTLRIDRQAYPDLEVRKGDKLVALDRDGQPIFEFQSVDDRSHLRLICDLGDTN
jgi:hypothetical protein